MVSIAVYLGAVTVLFFFWVYGIASFLLDVKNKFIPAVRRWRETRQAEQAAKEEDQEREELERQLY